MTVSIEHFLADIGEERRAAIEAGAAEIVAEQQTLAALRRARGMTQAQVAAAMETSQANVAQLERKSDTLVSTVARVVRALGADLELNARFPDGNVVPLKIGIDGSIAERQSSTAAIKSRTDAKTQYASYLEQISTRRPKSTISKRSTSMIEIIDKAGRAHAAASHSFNTIDATLAAAHQHLVESHFIMGHPTSLTTEQRSYFRNRRVFANRAVPFDSAELV